MKNRIDEIVKSAINNFLSEYRGKTENNGKLVSINENSIKRIIAKHSDNGYIAISPCRGGADFGLDPENSQRERDELARINKERVKKFIEILKASGFSYTPTYGGFIEDKDGENKESVYERSFLIYNKDKYGNNKDFKELYDFGLEMCRKFNQDSFLIQAPNENPKYVKQDGSVEAEFKHGKVFNDLSQTYFTDLHKNTDKFGDISHRKPTRMTFIEAYVNPKPQCYSERHVRWLNGEVF